MLVLTRRAGESFVMDGGIEITVVEVSGDKVRLGVTAPRSVLVLRKELVKEAEEVNREASSPEADLSDLARALSGMQPR